MEQMQAIWEALDEMLEKDPKKYEEFMKAQMETGRAFLAPPEGSSSGAGGTGSKLMSSVLSPFSTETNPGEKSGKVSGAGGGGDSYNNEKLKSVQVKENEGKQQSTNQKPDKSNLANEKEEDASFELKLPMGVAPTKINATTKGVLIQEISSTEIDDNEKLDKEEK